MKNLTDHIGDDRLMALIHTGDCSTIHELADEHLEECVQCQNRMEELAAEKWLWTNGKPIVKSTLEILDKGDHSTPLHSATKLDAASSLIPTVKIGELLQPPTHPEMLGRLGPYEIESIIGRGGMGVVFKAFDAELNRYVAIKMLLPHLASHAGARKRFLREARSAASINHESIVDIYQVHSEVPYPYLVMSLVPGKSLQAIIESDGPLGQIDIVEIGLQIAEGLAAAHCMGLIHRDIKPANVLLQTGSNRITITDFGLARTVNEASLTCTGLIAGTPHYMSPEQCNGRRVDAASDLFSLGCLLYFIAAGHTPFRGENAMAVMNRICTSNPRSIREINPEISGPLANTIHRLLEKQAADRFDSAFELADSLRKLLAHLHQPDVNPAPVVKLKSRKPALLQWVVGVLIALLFFKLGLVICQDLFFTKTPIVQPTTVQPEPVPFVQSADINQKLAQSIHDIYEKGESEEAMQAAGELKQRLKSVRSREDFENVVAKFQYKVKAILGKDPLDSAASDEAD